MVRRVILLQILHRTQLTLTLFFVPFFGTGYFEKNAHLFFCQSRFPPLPPISMLLPVVPPALAEVRADAVSRVYVNIAIGGSGGIHLVILVGN